LQSASLSVVLHSCSSSAFTAPAPTEIYTLSLHDALPISSTMVSALGSERGTLGVRMTLRASVVSVPSRSRKPKKLFSAERTRAKDRKSTRLNSSHVKISYAVFCLKKKKKNITHNNNKKDT